MSTATGKAAIEIDCGSPENAEAVQAALNPDNGGFVSTETRGATLLCTVPDAPMASMVRTVDDLLAAVTAALAAARMDTSQ